MINDMNKLRRKRSFWVIVNKKLRRGRECYELGLVGEIGFRYVST